MRNDGRMQTGTEEPKLESPKTIHNVIKQTKQKEWEKEETKRRDQ